MRIIFVRHAATANNEKGLLQEDHTPLSETGEKQAVRVGERLRLEKIDHIYSSPHTRTQQTAAEIAKHHNLPVVEHFAIRERDFGVFKGKPGKEYYEWRISNGFTWAEAKPETGESHLDVYNRTDKFIEHIQQKHQGETIVVVSHGGVITTTIVRLKGLSESKESYDANWHENTAISIANFGEEIDFELTACLEHLPDEHRTKRSK